MGGAIEQAVLYLREHPDQLADILDRIGGRENTDSCWVWTGAKSRGKYGMVSINGMVVNVGSLLVRYYTNPTNSPTHTCGTSGCVNPWHVGFPGRYAHEKRIRATPTIFMRQVNSDIARSCKNGHPIIGENVYVSTSKIKNGYAPYNRCRICTYLSTIEFCERTIEEIEQKIAERMSNGS